MLSYELTTRNMCRKRSLENAVIFDGKTRFMSFAIWVTSWFRVPVIVNSNFIALFLLLLRCFGALLARALDNFVSFSSEGFIEFLMGRTRYLEIFEPRKKSLTTHQSQIENHRRKQYVPTSKKPRNALRFDEFQHERFYRSCEHRRSASTRAVYEET